MNWRLLVLVLALIAGLGLQACRENAVSATTGPQAAGGTASEQASPAASGTPSEDGSPAAGETPSDQGSPAFSEAPSDQASPAAAGTAAEQGSAVAPAPAPVFFARKSYDTEQSWSDPQRSIALNYQQAQGKRVFYNTCVWCHADVTPAGPSNRSNLSPTPPLINNGETLNQISDEALQNIITLGGSAMGKSSMMPPWGQTLSQDDIQAVITYIRAVAEPAYQAPGRPASQYTVK